MRELIRKVRDTLKVEHHEAELLIATLLDRPVFRLYYEDTLDKHAVEILNKKIDQLQHGVPIEYITKTIQFMNCTLRIYPGVFIPRLETEYFVELLIKRFPQPPPLILEIGTGCGAISIALAHAFPASTIITTDISDRALACAHENINNYKLSAHIHPVRTNMFMGLSARFDLIVSNPPYIPLLRLHSLPKSVKYYEPLLALNGGDNGTMFTKIMIEHCSTVMTDKGSMAVEIDEDAVSDLKEFLERLGHLDFCFEKDLFNKSRYMFLEKTG